jgi:phenylpyruvate tautomerase PptA (4-oxalocrotonate tautomerase family)
MPMVRIDLQTGRSEVQRQAIGEAVYQALRSIGVPKDDRFQVIAEHHPSNFIFARAYLGLEHTTELIMVQITLNEGRTTDQKKVLFKAIAEGLHSAVGVRVEDVFIGLVEVKKENWSFGAGVAQYAEP